MHDWISLLAVPRFRAYWIALLAESLGSWCVLGAIPILVAERYGAGNELVLSLALRLAPKILLAPVSGMVLRRFGAAHTAGSAMLAMGVLTAALPWCPSFAILQIAIFGIGVFDVFINPGLLALRGAVTPRGLEMAGNTLFSVADRLAKISGPVVGGLGVAAGFKPAFLAFGIAIALSGLPVARLDAGPAADDTPHGRWRILEPIREFGQILRQEPRLAGLLICAVSYVVLMGGLRPFMFWANRDWYGASDAAWTGLLAAQGLGALVGALAAGMFSRPLLRAMSAYTVTLVTALMEGALHLVLLATWTSSQAMIVLALAGIPEVISTAAWFTVVQERLAPKQQTVFFALSMPMWDCAFAVGIASAALHANGMLSLPAYWLMISLISTLPNVPLLLWHLWPRQRPA